MEIAKINHITFINSSNNNDNYYNRNIPHNNKQVQNYTCINYSYVESTKTYINCSNKIISKYYNYTNICFPLKNNKNERKMIHVFQM